VTRPTLALVLLGAAALAFRLVYVLLVPDLDVDAYGHFHIGRAVLERPGDLKAMRTVTRARVRDRRSRTAI
jgi:hypothetical protein